MIRRTLLAVIVVCAAAALHPATAAASGTWVWPVTGPVIRGFDPPDDPYGAGHRGIDIAAPVGTPVLAAEAGTVTFGGKVGGQLFVSVEPDDAPRRPPAELSGAGIEHHRTKELHAAL